MGRTQTKRRTQKRKVLIVFGLILSLLLLAVGVAFAYFWTKLGLIGTGNSAGITASADSQLDSNQLEVNDLAPEVSGALGKYQTFAIFGLDNSAKEGYARGNTDVILIASVNNKTKEIRMCSVFRDTYLQMQVESGKTMFLKANAAYANGGVTNAVNMLNTNFDLDIKDYLAVNFKAVADTVDLLEGVEVTVTEDEAHYMIGYTDEVGEVSGKPAKYLPGAGTYLLDGPQAVAYARIRYGGGDDYKRAARQRLIIDLMAEKAKKSSFATINQIVDKVLPQVSTSLTRTQIVGLIKDVFSYHVGESAGFPFILNTKSMPQGNLGYQDVVIPVDLITNVEQLHEFLYDQTDYKPSGVVQKISDQIAENTGFTADSPSYTPDFAPPSE